MALNKEKQKVLQHIYDFVLEFSTNGSDLYDDIWAARDEADTVRWNLQHTFAEDIDVSLD